ncbi:universal stress protein [Streptomyces sp. NPDC048581]|uniref:universal stress protein n=1 Tax=unclassified Streptomyces TaxID=2593676 RepID=UPI003711713B
MPLRAGLVVVPRHPVEGRLGLRLGSVVHAVLHHAGCPVAVVPVRWAAVAEGSAVRGGVSSGHDVAWPPTSPRACDRGR